jgi:imidazolonepropionase-like amidohydrolase
VLEATTRSAAELLGVDDELGTIAEGKLADLAVVAGDPYDFTDLGDRVEQVWQGGRRVV